MKIGVDGGGTKTELILVDDAGAVVARHTAAGCNPSVAGADAARRTLIDALTHLTRPPHDLTGQREGRITHTALFMAGARAFWRETADALTAGGAFGQVASHDDSLPVLELATDGAPGLVLHAGTGSFVAARAPDGSIHYAGGTGWRFGDPGSGYDLGRRAISRALLELQGWQTPSRLGPTIRAHAGLDDAADAQAITRYFYQHAEPNRLIASLAPAVIRLAAEGDHTAHQLLVDSTGELLALAERVAAKLFPGTACTALPVGLSGPILTHPVVLAAVTPRTALTLKPITEAPIEGVRRLLARRS